MDPEKQNNFHSDDTTPTRLSLEDGQHGPSHSTLQDEKANEKEDGADSQTVRTGGELDKEAERELDLETGVGSRPAEDRKAPDKDPNLVEWDGPDDPENPQNFSRSRKWLITMILSTMTVWITFSTSVFSEATLVTAEEYHVSTEVTTLATSLPVFVSHPVVCYSSGIVLTCLGLCCRAAVLGSAV